MGIGFRSANVVGYGGNKILDPTSRSNKHATFVILEEEEVRHDQGGGRLDWMLMMIPRMTPETHSEMEKSMEFRITYPK